MPLTPTEDVDEKRRDRKRMEAKEYKKRILDDCAILHIQCSKVVGMRDLEMVFRARHLQRMAVPFMPFQLSPSSFTIAPVPITLSSQMPLPVSLS